MSDERRARREERGANSKAQMITKSEPAPSDRDGKTAMSDNDGGMSDEGTQRSGKTVRKPRKRGPGRQRKKAGRGTARREAKGSNTMME